MLVVAIWLKELKNLKKLWKQNFPVNGSERLENSSKINVSLRNLNANQVNFAENTKNGADNNINNKGFSQKNAIQLKNIEKSDESLAKTVLSDLKDIKNEINSEKFTEKNKQQVLQNDIFSDTKVDEGLVLLGELLKTLRQNKDFTVLMTCRKITKIEFDGKVAVIDYEDDSVKDLVSNEKYYAVMQEFFNKKGLSFRLKEKIQQENDKDKLNKLLGGKLVLKSINKDLYL